MLIYSPHAYCSDVTFDFQFIHSSSSFPSLSIARTFKVDSFFMWV